jgi:hypothetical protein
MAAMLNTIENQTELFPIPYSYAEKLLIQSGLKVYAYQCARIPKPIVHRYFKTYYLLYWSRTYLVDRIVSGHITHDGIEYRVIYGSTVTRGRILQSADSNQFALSFRIADSQYNIDPVVIISKKAGGNHV